MNEDIIKGKWEQMKGKVKQQWGKLTDDDVTKVNGDAQPKTDFLLILVFRILHFYSCVKI